GCSSRELDWCRRAVGEMILDSTRRNFVVSLNRRPTAFQLHSSTHAQQLTAYPIYLSEPHHPTRRLAPSQSNQALLAWRSTALSSVVRGRRGAVRSPKALARC